MEKCCIVIPVYKVHPSENELISFKKNIQTLRDFHISILSPDIDLRNYTRILTEKGITNYSIDHFDNEYFKDLSGYNKLMTSLNFYTYYNKYKYILICQLDVYIFKNELIYWCDQNYDYIGAPWFTKYGCHEHGDTLWKIGNGGLSLRKVQFFINILNRKRPVYGMKAIYEKNHLSNNKYLIIRLTLLILYTFGYNNNVKYFLKHTSSPEDIFFMDLLSNSLITFNCPSPLEGIKFAFECSPEYLYKLNNRQLPFGCHAWERYGFKFWKKFIM